jgi:hypothetical protein
VAGLELSGGANIDQQGWRVGPAEQFDGLLGRDLGHAVEHEPVEGWRRHADDGGEKHEEQD